MKYNQFQEQRFLASVGKALKRVESILDTTRNPRLLEHAQHTYDDKYILAALLTNTSLAAQICALEQLGLDGKNLVKVCNWVHKDKHDVILRFEARDSCTFMKAEDVKQVTCEKSTEEKKSFWMGLMDPNPENSASADKVVNHVKEYHWKVEVNYRIIVFSEDDPESKTIELEVGNKSKTIITPVVEHSPPIAKRTVHPNIDADLTWFLKMISPEDKVCQFAIDKSARDENGMKTCKTPRRNKNVDEAYEFYKTLAEWAIQTRQFFLDRVENEVMDKHNPVNPVKLTGADAVSTLKPDSLCKIVGSSSNPDFNDSFVTIINYCPDKKRYRVKPVDSNTGLPPKFLVKPENLELDKIDPALPAVPLTAVTADDLFCPLLPLMKKSSALDTGDVVELLNAQLSSIDDAMENLTRVYPPEDTTRMVSFVEATIVLMCQHMSQISLQYNDSIDYLEHGLEKELMNAIGKEVSAKDFDRFVRFHGRKMFHHEYAPKPFFYAIRRPNHSPDCILSIEGGSTKNEPIETTCRVVPGASSSPLWIPLAPTLSVEITGDKHLHGWMQQHFDGKSQADHQIVAKAQQYSACIVVVGSMGGADNFVPKHALILKNRDEFSIPLQICSLPTDREFKEALSSLSPEQKEFCESFRGMQLQSSVFGVCVIQLKPQLEKLLMLPDGALTKEKQLTEDLISLFVEHQIPSDLVLYNGPPEADHATKVEAVRGYVESVKKDIEKAKQEALQKKGGFLFSSIESALKDTFLDVKFPTDHVGGGKAEGVRIIRMDDETEFGESLSNSSMTGIPPVSEPDIVSSGESVVGSSKAIANSDFTKIPKQLDEKIVRFDAEDSLRTAVIKPVGMWKRRQVNVLKSSAITTSMTQEEIKTEKRDAFHLLEAISCSGTLPISCAELHLIFAVSHQFEKDVMAAVIQDNINPIEKMEKSALLLAATVHGVKPNKLIKDEQTRQRLVHSFPQLLEQQRNPMKALCDGEARDVLKPLGKGYKTKSKYQRKIRDSGTVISGTTAPF